MPELCCLEPSSLNRPHPPHSWAHRIFTAWRLIRDAFAVRERLGDPRVVPGFRYPFCPGIPSSPTPGSSIIVSSSAAMSTRPSPRVDRLGTPKTPAIRFTRAMTFVASWFTHLLRSASLLAPCTDLTGYPASGAFTSGRSAGWSPFSLQDITTTATGLLCWRDSHPLEWQLASLHLLLHRSGLSPHSPCQSPGALTHVTARWIARPPKATFVTRLRPTRLPDQAARQLPGQSTTLRMAPSSTGDTRPRGAQNTGRKQGARVMYGA